MTLSQLVWRMFGRQPAGYVERVLAFNQDLALQSPYLTVGSVVKLPIENIEADTRRRDVVRLTD
nr:tail protein X [Cupriavidus sp. IK-TO18]